MRVILFGATGMVGQSVLRECLLDDTVQEVLVISRRPTGDVHPKLRQLVREDLFEFTIGEHLLEGYDACLFCLGVSSVGMSEAEYTRITFDLTLGWARALARVNPRMTFLYVSGAGTGGRAMWARVKGRTEAALLDLFPSAYMIRLGAVRPVHGERSRSRWIRIAYLVLRPLWPLVRLVAPNAVITTEELGRAMLRVAREGAPRRLLDNRTLRLLANPATQSPGGT